MHSNDGFIHGHDHLIAFANKHLDNDNSKGLEPLYQYVNSALVTGYAVIYGAESFSNESERETILNKIIRATPVNNNENVQNCIDRGLLRITDPKSMYGNDKNGEDIVKYWVSRYLEQSKIKDLDQNIRGIVGVNVPNPYFERDKYNIFFGFEQKLDLHLDDNMSMLCWYKKRWLDELDLPKLITTLNLHNKVLHKDFQYSNWNAERIINAISRAIDKQDDSKENETSTLLFETIRHAYHLDKESLIANPQNLENALSKTLGRDTYYQTVQPSILEDLKKEISFSTNPVQLRV